MIWWLAQPSRARQESLAIAELENQHAWLRNVEWFIGKDARLSANFEVQRLGRVIPMSIHYPSFFPDMPPQVVPREAVLLSGHQYGSGGELCLEYRPDNWEASFTGAMMIESAHRLLEGEEPTEGVRAVVDSAHSTTVSQDVRSSKLRFLVSSGFASAIRSLEVCTPTQIEVSEHFTAKHWIAVPRRLGGDDDPLWTAEADVPLNRRRNGFAVRVDAALKSSIRADYDSINDIAGTLKHEGLLALLRETADEAVILIECEGDFHLMWLLNGSGKREIFGYTSVSAPADVSRLPSGYDHLSVASVAIVGCGSVGSKIAASLARAGVGSFVLVDGDIFFPANLVRNDLDWRSVGLNKPDAVAERIHEIMPSARVATWRVVLGGQESSSSTDAALVAVGRCDLIVDATADPLIFNLCASVSRNEKKTLVWGEVFGGGIGGMIARVRPDVEPVPHAAKRQLLQWCTDRGREPPAGENVQYGLVSDESSPPLVADDTDVGVIAAHMTRLALDALTRTESLFPQPAYAIGLKAEWIFEAPFDTWPISLVPEGTWGPQKDERLEEELAALAKQLFPEVGRDGVD